MITRQENGQRTVYLMQNFHNTDYKAMGVIHPDQAFESVYDFRYIIEVTVAITAAAILIIFILVRQQTKPLSKLIEKYAGRCRTEDWIKLGKGGGNSGDPGAFRYL